MSSDTVQQDLEPAFKGMRPARSNDQTINTPEQPDPATCEFCGKTLYWLGPCINGIVKTWWMVEQCDCEKAVERQAAELAALEKKRRVEREELDRARKRERIERLIGNSGIGKRFQCRTFDRFVCATEEQKTCFEVAKKYADNFEEYLSNGTGLVLFGSVGTGKTHLAAAIALQLLSNGVPVVFKTSIDLFSDIRGTYNSDVSESKIMDTYNTTDLLIIDDLGKEKITTWSASMLFAIINARYERMLPTIITTNLGYNDLSNMLGDDRTRAEAIVSRIREQSVNLKMAWADYRMGHSA